VKEGIWVSYDLGLRGDYPALYAWLDDHGAKECCDSVAYLRYEYTGDLLASLKRELLPLVKGNPSARLYVMRVARESNHGAKGTFLVGKRKSPAWSGFGSSGAQEVDE
jgi:hypothetical protein